MSSVAAQAAGPRRSGRFQLDAIYFSAIAGGVGALFGLYLYTELLSGEAVRNVYARDALAGALIGGALGYFLNAAEPLRDGAWFKLARAATWGAMAGALGGAAGLVVGEALLGLFRGGLLGRAVSWAVLGLGLGLSQGLAYRSVSRMKMGLLGGGLGGLIGGFCFEWFRAAIGNDDRSARLSQAPGILILGAGLGLCLALVEQALRGAWVRVLQGRQEGRAYWLASQSSRIGLDEHAEVGLFGDPEIARQHARIERTGVGYVLHGLDPKGRTRHNGKPLAGATTLKDGDRIEIGRTLLEFRQR